MAIALVSGADVRAGIHRDYKMEFKDVNIKCVTCGRDFIFTAREQEFFFSKGFKEPRHCRECRQRRKQDRERIFAEASGQEYQPGKDLFKVVCAECKRETSVPFKPITGKPVLCKDCFIAQRYGSKAGEEIPAPGEPKEPVGTEEPPTEEVRPSATSEAIPQPGPEIDLEADKEPPEEVESEDERPQQDVEPEKTSDVTTPEEKDDVKKAKETPEESESEDEQPPQDVEPEKSSDATAPEEKDDIKKTDEDSEKLQTDERPPKQRKKSAKSKSSVSEETGKQKET